MISKFFCLLFLKNKVQINKNNYRVMFIMSKQVLLPKSSSILPKMKISPKSDICLFCSLQFRSLKWVVPEINPHPLTDGNPGGRRDYTKKSLLQGPFQLIVHVIKTFSSHTKTQHPTVV